MAAQLGSYDFQGHKSLGFWNGRQPEPGVMAAVYRLPADALCAQDAELLRQNREDAAAVLAEQPLDAALWREPCGISILGDSISSWRLSFLHILREALRGYPAVFHDFSVSGQKSGDLLAAMYPDIARAHAQLAHIMIGTNDCRRTLDVPNVLHTGLPEYEKNVRFLVSALQAGGSRVIISSIPPVDAAAIAHDFPAHRILYREDDRLAFNAALDIAENGHARVKPQLLLNLPPDLHSAGRALGHDDHEVRLAAETGAVFNDMEPLYRAYAPQELTIDGIHLNRGAQRLLAGRVLQCMQALRRQ